MDTDFWLSILDYFYICDPFPVTSLLWVLQSCPRGLQLSEILIQLLLLANFMENRLVLAEILAIKNNNLHILSVGEKIITLHLEEFVLTEFGRPVIVPVTVIVVSHCVKSPVMRVQCVILSTLHTVWFCRFALLLHMLLTEPEPSGINGLNVWYGLLGNYLLDICLFLMEKTCYGGGVKIILIHCRTFSKMGYIPPKS